MATRRYAKQKWDNPPEAFPAATWGHAAPEVGSAPAALEPYAEGVPTVPPPDLPARTPSSSRTGLAELPPATPAPPSSTTASAGPAEATPGPATTGRTSTEGADGDPTVAITARTRGPRAPTWRGGFRFAPFVVGEPGAGSSVQNRLDHDIPHRPDTVLDELSVYASTAVPPGRARPDAEVRAASVRGLSHRYGGTVRQDEYGVRQSADGRYLVAVVADGVSAGSQSHRAAVVAAQRGCEYLVGLLTEHAPDALPWREVLDGLTREILMLGRKVLRLGDGPLEDDVRPVARAMSTTALFAVVDLAGDHPHPVYLLPVGDTSAWVLRDGRRWESPQPVKNHDAEIATSAVRALPDVRATEHVPLRTTLARGEVLLLMTDGVGDALLDGDNDFGDYLAAMWARPPAALEFAAQVDFRRKSFDDDRTVVGIWPGDHR